MWTLDDISIEIDEAEWPAVIIAVGTPAGELLMTGNVTLRERRLLIDQAHVQGLWKGAINREGLNAIGRKLLEIADVDEIEIQGATRTTGANKGRPPRSFRFPSGSRAPGTRSPGTGHGDPDAVGLGSRPQEGS